MSAIIFNVSDSPVSEARLGTEQEFIFESGVILTEFTPPKTIYKGSYASSMDQLSGRGTRISKHQTSTIGMVYPVAYRAYVEELIDSLSDYQIATFDGTDIDYFEKEQDFVIMLSDLEPLTRGCTKLSASIGVKWM